MITPLVLRTVHVTVFPEPKEIRVNLFAIGPGKLLDHEREQLRLKKK